MHHDREHGGEVKRNIRGAVELHLEGMREEGEPIPKPTTSVSYLELQVSQSGIV
jgi:predicted RNase H-like HicB family nuclease